MVYDKLIYFIWPSNIHIFFLLFDNKFNIAKQITSFKLKNDLRKGMIMIFKCI
jgi:hypothetical protein